jgi:hypothetical protein
VRNNGLAHMIAQSNLRGRGGRSKRGKGASSTTATELAEREAKSLGPKPLKLDMAQEFQARAVKRAQRYAAAFSKLEQWGIPVMRVSYERLLQVPDTMIEVMRFVGTDVSEVQVSESSHSAGPHLVKKAGREFTRVSRQWIETAGGRLSDPFGALDLLQVDSVGNLKGAGWSHPLFSTRWHVNSTRQYLSNADQVSSWIESGKLPGWETCMLDDTCATEPPLVSGAATSVAAKARAAAAKEAAVTWKKERSALLARLALPHPARDRHTAVRRAPGSVRAGSPPTRRLSGGSAE